MGVPNYQHYQYTSHFLERLNDRFNVPASEAASWALRFLQNAKYVSKQDNGHELWCLQDIFGVLDTSSKHLITVYYHEPDGYSQPANPEIATVVKNELQKLKAKAQKRTARKVTEYFNENAILYRKIGNSRNNKYLQKYEEKADRNNVLIRKTLSSCDSLISEIDARIG